MAAPVHDDKQTTSLTSADVSWTPGHGSSCEAKDKLGTMQGFDSLAPSSSYPIDVQSMIESICLYPSMYSTNTPL